MVVVVVGGSSSRSRRQSIVVVVVVMKLQQQLPYIASLSLYIGTVMVGRRFWSFRIYDNDIEGNRRNSIINDSLNP